MDQMDPHISLDQTGLGLLIKADRLLDKIYEIVHGDAESVSHQYLLKQYADVRAMHDRVLAELGDLDRKYNELVTQHTELVTRIAGFAKGVNERFAALKQGGKDGAIQGDKAS